MAVRWEKNDGDCRHFMFRAHPQGEAHGEQMPAMIVEAYGEARLHRHGFPPETFRRVAQAKRAAVAWLEAGGFEDGVARIERAAAERDAGVVRFSVAAG
jgi:hypothetical protein